MQPRYLYNGQIVKIVGEDENHGKIGLVRYINFNIITLDNMEARNNYFQTNIEKIQYCGTNNLDFLVKTKN